MNCSNGFNVRDIFTVPLTCSALFQSQDLSAQDNLRNQDATRARDMPTPVPTTVNAWVPVKYSPALTVINAKCGSNVLVDVYSRVSACPVGY